jgi:tetratricopeptide (TPR) repeat protein
LGREKISVKSNLPKLREQYVSGVANNKRERFMIEKSIFISHSSKDEEAALNIGVALEKKFGKNSIWIDYFSLSGGDELVPVISNAIGKAKWFILVASKQSMSSSWVVHEAKLALFQSIEKKDFQIITIKIDDCKFPPEIDLELRSRKYIDATSDFNKAVDELVEVVNSQVATRSNRKNVFVDRGNEIDNLEAAFSKSKVIYVVGWHGIGKTSVIEEFANTRLGAPFLKIDITPGHDTELLCRQIIARTGANQPSSAADKDKLLETAFQALEKKFVSDNGFLLLDDAEKAMDDAGQFRSYLEEFINYFYSHTAFDNPLVLSTIQQPEIKINNAEKSTIVIIRPLPDSFVVQCVEKWYYAITNEKINASLDSVLNTIGGHPLSAYLLASYLAFESPELLTRKGFVSTFRKNSAEYILKSYMTHFKSLDFLLLQAIAVVSTGVSVSDLSVLPLVRKEVGNSDVLDTVKESLSKLAKRLLLVQDGEKLLLHPFVAQVFMDQSKDEKNYLQIAGEFANIFYNRTLDILAKLKAFDADINRTENRQFKQLNYQLMEYLAPSHRLLVISGQNDKARNLPYKFYGYLREMVFVSYQKLRDYLSVINYADQWLLLEPVDLEVMTYKARALRRLGKENDAQELLMRLAKYPQDRIQAIVSRELGYIARDNDDLETAIYHFTHSASFRNRSGNLLYPQAQADLASALVNRADSRGARDPNRIPEYQRAIKLYDEARRFLSDFDLFHLPTYINALMNVEREEEAFELLREALELNPDDSRLNLRMADILRKDPSKLDEAYKHAELAIRGNQLAALTIMATIRLDQERFKDVVELTKSFKPVTVREQMVTKTIEAKAFTGMGEFQHANSLLEKLDYESDPHVYLALINNSYEEIRSLFYSDKVSEAKDKFYKYSKFLEDSSIYFPHHTQFIPLIKNRDEIKKLLQIK